MTESKTIHYEWKENLSSKEWDNLLSILNGHPLQSAKWGDAKKLSNGIKDHRWAAFKNGVPIFLVRFEERWFLKLLKIAWAPKGPTASCKQEEDKLHKEFLFKLKKRGFFLCATNPWRKIEITNKLRSAFYTIWIDLTLKKEKLWENLHKQCRYDIRRAKKLGVIIEKSNSHDDLKSFYQSCESISKSKGFSLGASLQLMWHLFSSSDHVESNLFVARYEGNFCGGAFILLCGESVHYIWGAVNREFSHLCIGEALQWEIIEWALSKNCKKYDLEGIASPEQNSGVDRFKKKLGGTVIAYPGVQIYPLYIGHKITQYLMNIYLELQPKLIRLTNYFTLDKFFSFLKGKKLPSKL